MNLSAPEFVDRGGSLQIIDRVALPFGEIRSEPANGCARMRPGEVSHAVPRYS